MDIFLLKNTASRQKDRYWRFETKNELQYIQSEKEPS